MGVKKISTPRGAIISGANGKAELKWNTDIAANRNAQFTRQQMFVDSEV